MSLGLSLAIIIDGALRHERSNDTERFVRENEAHDDRVEQLRVITRPEPPREES